MILVLIQAIFFIGYIFYVYKTVGEQKSISYSWYVIPNKNMFFVFSAGVGLPMLLYSLYVPDELTQLVFAIAGFSMWGLSLSIMVKQAKYVLLIHYICTLSVILCSYYGIYRHFDDYYHLILGAAGSIVFAFIPKNKLWWIELWIFATIIGKLIQL